jgi:DEAD/DEAH box helicase
MGSSWRPRVSWRSRSNRRLESLLRHLTFVACQSLEGYVFKFSPVYHGANILQRAVEEQQFNLREGAEIIIATPGRLKDVLERHVLVLSQCRYVVMDEADRMVHLGFEADLTFILDQLPSETMEGEDQSEQMDVDGETMVKKGRTRVTTLFSATMPPPVERLARKYLKRPAVITIGEAGRAVDTVEQRVEFVIGEEKKKCGVQPSMTKKVMTNASFLFPDSVLSRSSTVGSTRLPSSFLSTRKRLQIWWRKISIVLVYVRHLLMILIMRADSWPSCSGAPQLYIRAKTKSNEKLRCSHFAPVPPMCWSLRTSPDAVSTCRMFHLSSTSRWLAQLRLMCIA